MERVEEHAGGADVGRKTPADEPDERDEEVEDPPVDGFGRPPSPLDHWRRHSALGAVGTGVARGLQAVFAPPVDEPAVVAEAPGEPPGPASGVQVILDPDDPTKSVAIVADPDQAGGQSSSPA